MSSDPNNTNVPKPGPYDVVDPNHQGVDPEKPVRYRDPKNARRNRHQEIADGVDFDVFG